MAGTIEDRLKRLECNLQKLYSTTAQIVNVETVADVYAYNLTKRKILFIVANDEVNNVESSGWLWDGTTLSSFMSMAAVPQPS